MLLFFFFNDTATTEIYTLSLHDALPISHGVETGAMRVVAVFGGGGAKAIAHVGAWKAIREAGGEVTHIVATSDRKSTRLNSSHGYISYAVFCLKKKKNIL